MKVHAVTGERTPLFDLTRFETALDDLPGVTAAQARRLSRQTTHRWNANRTALMFDLWNDLYYYELGDDRVRRLTRTPETEEVATFSPDGRLVAFVRARNLVVVDVDHRREARADHRRGAARSAMACSTGSIRRKSTAAATSRGTGGARTRHGSPYLRLDDSNVPTYTVLDHIPYRPEVENWDYPKAGDPNPAVRLGVVRSAGRRHTVDRHRRLPAPTAADRQCQLEPRQQRRDLPDPGPRADMARPERQRPRQPASHGDCFARPPTPGSTSWARRAGWPTARFSG